MTKCCNMNANGNVDEITYPTYNQGEVTVSASALAFIKQAIGGLRMTTRDIPTPEMLRKLLRYEPETGKIFWRNRTPDLFTDGYRTAEGMCRWWNATYANGEAMTADDGDGFLTGMVFGKKYRAHRVIWAIETGAWPDGQIDHKDHVRNNNRWSNLREVTSQINAMNQSMRVTNTSGVMGVSWSKASRKWVANINIGGKQKSLGLFTEKSDAIAARQAANLDAGYHHNHGMLTR